MLILKKCSRNDKMFIDKKLFAIFFVDCDFWKKCSHNKQKVHQLEQNVHELHKSSLNLENVHKNKKWLWIKKSSSI